MYTVYFQTKKLQLITISSRLPMWHQFKEQLEKAPDAYHETEDCEICGLEFETERPITIPCPSRHVFGVDCIMSWFETMGTDGVQCNTCPKCRVQLFQAAISEAATGNNADENFEDWQEDTLDWLRDFDFGTVLGEISLGHVSPAQAKKMVALLRLRPWVGYLMAAIDRMESWEDANNFLYSFDNFTPRPGHPSEGETELTNAQIVSIQYEFDCRWARVHQTWRSAGGPSLSLSGWSETESSETEMIEPIAQIDSTDKISPAVSAAIEKIQAIVRARNPTRALINHVNDLTEFVMCGETITLHGIACARYSMRQT